MTCRWPSNCKRRRIWRHVLKSRSAKKTCELGVELFPCSSHLIRELKAVALFQVDWWHVGSRLISLLPLIICCCASIDTGLRHRVARTGVDTSAFLFLFLSLELLQCVRSYKVAVWQGLVRSQWQETAACFLMGFPAKAGSARQDIFPSCCTTSQLVSCSVMPPIRCSWW